MFKKFNAKLCSKLYMKIPAKPMKLTALMLINKKLPLCFKQKKKWHKNSNFSVLVQEEKSKYFFLLFSANRQSF